MMASALRSHYPWTSVPFVVGAPMMKITMARLAVAVSRAGGLGFVAGGFDLSGLEKDMDEAAELLKSYAMQSRDGVLPVGIGFQNWGSDIKLAIPIMKKHQPAAVWLFAPYQPSDLLPWVKETRTATDGKTKIWVQVGTVAEAIEVAKTIKPDVIVLQGSDAGGHGLQQRASIISLLPEVSDAFGKAGIEIPLIAAGGISDGRGVAAALTLGASGVALGTRFLAAEEATIAKGYQNEVLRVSDGGVSTTNTKVYDMVRGILDWPIAYDARGVVNRSYLDALHGMSEEENRELYKEAMKLGDDGWGPEGRMTTYAGTGIGLIDKVVPAETIVGEIQKEALEVLESTARKFRH